MKKSKNNRKKNIIKIILTLGIIGSGVFFLKAPQPDTFLTFTRSQEPVIYANACKDNLAQLLSQAIDSANQDVFLRIYNLSSPDIFNSLAKQIDAQRHVSIHYQSCKDVKQFNQTPYLTLVEHPKERRKLMHQKALSIDNNQAWLGSANYTNTSFYQDSNIVIGLKSSELCEGIIQDASCTFTVNGQPAQYFSLPNDGQLALQALLNKIKTAQKTIRVAMFALTYPPILQELHKAEQRGVKLEIIIDREFKNLCINQIQKIAGCNFSLRYKVTPYKLHYKFAIIDQNSLIVGSVNWSENGFRVNSEDMLILDRLTQKQIKKLDRIWNNLKAESDPVPLINTTSQFEEVLEKQAA